MDIEDASERANALVRSYVLDCYRKAARGRRVHLATCPEVRVADLSGGDGGYGCDTGCEYVRLEAVLTCPHGEREVYQYGDFGELATILDELEREA